MSLTMPFVSVSDLFRNFSMLFLLKASLSLLLFLFLLYKNIYFGSLAKLILKYFPQIITFQVYILEKEHLFYLWIVEIM